MEIGSVTSGELRLTCGCLMSFLFTPIAYNSLYKQFDMSMGNYKIIGNADCTYHGKTHPLDKKV